MTDERDRLGLLAKLNDKVQEEHQTYRETLYHMTVDEVVELSYKTAYR